MGRRRNRFRSARTQGGSRSATTLPDSRQWGTGPLLTVVTRMLPAAVHVIVKVTAVVSARVTFATLGFGSATAQLSAIPLSSTLCVPALNGVIVTTPLLGIAVVAPPSTPTRYPSA